MADALLSPPVGLAFDAAAALLVGGAARQLSREPEQPRRVALMGVLGAFVFAAQMVNFAIPGTGSSGHLAGGLLLAVLLGPSASLLVIASVLLVQALFFADGGLLALGCNLFNMGLWPALFGLPLQRRLAGERPGTLRLTLACLVPAVIAAELGALGVMAETQLSGRADLPYARFAALMLGVHLPIGVVEGLVTAAMIRFAGRLGAIGSGARNGAPAGRLPLAPTLLALAVFLGCVGSSFASTRPDGLEWALARAGAAVPAGAGQTHALLRAVQAHTAILPDYALPAREGGAAGAVELGTSLAGGLGLFATIGIVTAGMALCRRGRAAGRSRAG